MISSTRARLGRQRRQLELEPLELRAPDRLEPLAQRDHGRNRPARPEPAAELFDFLVDDGLRAGDLAGAPCEVLADRRLQVVDVVEEHLLDFAGRRLHIARHRDVDDEERAVAPRPHDGLDVRLGENRRRRAGRGDDDVAGAEHGVELFPRRGAGAADRLRCPRRVRHRPADDRDVLDGLRLHVQRGELAHFAGADDRDAPAAEVAENLARERDGRVAHRDRARAEAGLGPHPLADGERRVEQPVEHRARRVGVGGERVRVLHLAENLRLAHDERVEAGRDAEQVARDVQIGDVVHVRRDLAGGDAVEVAHEAHQILARLRRLVARDVELGAVARRDDNRFARRAALGERAQRVGDAARLEVDAFAQLDRRRAMTDSNKEKVHR